MFALLFFCWLLLFQKIYKNLFHVISFWIFVVVGFHMYMADTERARRFHISVLNIIRGLRIEDVRGVSFNLSWILIHYISYISISSLGFFFIFFYYLFLNIILDQSFFIILRNYTVTRTPTIKHALPTSKFHVQIQFLKSRNRSRNSN